MSGLVVAVVAGGPSAEAAVSRKSAEGVARALAAAGHRPEIVELDAGLPGRLGELRADVVFPAVHGQLGEDGGLQGLLEVLDVPYVGSGVLASAVAMSKRHAKALFAREGLPIAPEVVVRRGEDVAAAARAIRERLGVAVVVKPGAGGSAIGVEILAAGSSETALAAALDRALALDPEVLVETFVAGVEVTCGVLEDEMGRAGALPTTLIRPREGTFYDFRSKYAIGGSLHECPAPFPASLNERIGAAAVRAHEVVGARDLSRVDFVVDVDRATFTLLEVNTLPGMTATSLFPEAAAVAGVSFPVLCDRLVRRAAARPRRTAPAVMPMPT